MPSDTLEVMYECTYIQKFSKCSYTHVTYVDNVHVNVHMYIHNKMGYVYIYTHCLKVETSGMKQFNAVWLDGKLFSFLNEILSSQIFQ